MIAACALDMAAEAMAVRCGCGAAGWGGCALRHGHVQCGAGGREGMRCGAHGSQGPNLQWSEAGSAAGRRMASAVVLTRSGVQTVDAAECVRHEPHSANELGMRRVRPHACTVCWALRGS